VTELALPLDWQLEGAQFLADRTQAFLADEPGIGKSGQAVRACDLIGAWNVLILVPASVRVNWLNEFKKFSPFDRQETAVFDGKTSPGASGVTVCSYDLLANKKLRASLLARHWDVLILDEAHMLKTRTASRTKAVYGRKSDGLTGLMTSATRVWRLSGTPAPNFVDELWTHLRSAGLYQKNYYDFVDEFCSGFKSDYGFRITGTKNAERLRALLDPFMLRRKKSTVLPKLPPIEFENHTVEPTAVDARAYFGTLKEYDPYLHEDIERQNAQLKDAVKAGDNTLEYLRSVATSVGTLRRYIGISKVPGYLAVVKPELKARRYDKLLIGAWHTDVIEALRVGLRDFGAVTLYGGTPADKRQQLLDKFKTNRACRVLICQVKVGIGFNATAAYRVDLLEPSWVPAENKQFIDRAHRIGQDCTVTVRYFGCNRSVDADITKALALKGRELAKVFD